MHKTEVTSSGCVNCGRGNTPDGQTGMRPIFVDFERDINWNDPLIICEDCLAAAGSLVGMMSVDTKRTLQREISKLMKELHEKDAEIDSMKRRARRIGI